MAIKKLPSTGDTPRATGVPDSLAAGGTGDSAGLPWAGRTFDHHETAFAGDDGTTPVAVAEAVAAVRAATARMEATDSSDAYWAAVAGLADAHGGVIRALGGERVLVPMLAEAGDLGTTPEGRTVEKTQELSIVTVAAPDGRRVLPIFSSTDSMTAWHDGARPIPVPGAQAAVAAAQEETDLMMLDAASADVEFGVRRPALKALALGEAYVPAWGDRAVQAAFAETADIEPDVASLWIAPGDPASRMMTPDVSVHVRIRAGLDAAGLRAILGRLQQRWAANETIVERVDSMSIKPIAA